MIDWMIDAVLQVEPEQAAPQWAAPALGVIGQLRTRRNFDHD